MWGAANLYCRACGSDFTSAKELLHAHHCTISTMVDSPIDPPWREKGQSDDGTVCRNVWVGNKQKGVGKAKKSA